MSSCSSYVLIIFSALYLLSLIIYPDEIMLHSCQLADTKYENLIKFAKTFFILYLIRQW